MTTLLLILGSAGLYLLAYHTYGRWLGRKILGVNPDNPTPAHVRGDGVDYVPSHRQVVFGHHFTSIAGTGPIVGPSIAVIWGWLPALLWVVFGSIFMGAVHDFGALVMSLRNQGRTIGDYCGDIINRRTRLLFLLIICFALWIVIAIFGLVVATIFAMYPQSVFPVWIQLPIALALGAYMARGGKHIVAGGVISAVLLYGAILASSYIPALQLAVVSSDAQRAAVAEGVTVLQLPFLSNVGFWTIILLIYCFFASVMPVNRLLQPRDYINAYQLVMAMGLLCLGALIARPELVAPVIDLRPDKPGVPLWAPFLFITVACGACSGFHSLVSSGCSSKQLRTEADAQYVGFGAMLLEGFLAVLVIVACCAGLGMGDGNGLTGVAAWNASYATFTEGMSILKGMVAGSANMMETIPGMTHPFALGIIGVFIAAFAATTLDTAARLQRYIISEIGGTVGLPILKDKYVATTIAAGSALLLAFFDAFQHKEGLVEGLKVGGKGAFITLWPVFGATNQLLAGLALLVLTVWLLRKGKPTWVAAIPMGFMLAMTGWALAIQVKEFWTAGPGQNLFLAGVGTCILALEVWMIAEAGMFLWGLRERRSKGAALEPMLESA